jgi:hypothetical protein
VARRASSLAAKDIDAYLLAVEDLLKTRPGVAKELANFLRASAKAAAPVEFLNAVKALVARPGVTKEALQVLGDKALAGSVDIPWLNKLTLSDADLSFLASDPRTNWNGLKSAIEGGKKGPIGRMMAKVRGAAAELAAEESLGDVLPGYRLVRRQVEVPGAVVDFELMATDGTGRRIGFEVKGYSGDKWRDALNAFRLDAENAALPAAQRVALSKEQEGYVKMLKDAIKQIKAEQAAYPGGVKLGVTSDLSGPTKNKLEKFLAENLPGVELVPIQEYKIAETARRFRSGLGLVMPE